MPGTSTFPLYNQILGGRLKAQLARWRRSGVTFEQIAQRLHEQKIDVSATTVHRWCHQLGIEEERAS